MFLSHVPRALFTLSLVGLVPLFSACEDDPDPPAAPRVSLTFVHQASGTVLVQDALVHTNEAGNAYGVDKFEYLLTNIRLLGADAKADFSKHTESFSSPHYGNAFDAATHSVDFGEVAEEDYERLTFQWGVALDDNISESLDDAFDGMLWPEVNGGGYHCMRFEGDYTDQIPGDKSYTLHMGRLDRFSALTNGSVEIDLPVDLSPAPGETWEIQVLVDVNGFMNDPVYDFEATHEDPGNPGTFIPLATKTMPSHTAQGLMRDNMGDVFSIGTITKK